MKRNLYALGLMLAAAFTLTNCAQEIANPNEQPETAGYPFEIVASTVDTKTVNDGMATKWAEGDQINLFHAVGETTEYVNDDAFSLKDLEEGKFEGKLGDELDSQEEYDWYALYPYNDKIETPGDKTVGFTYIGYSSELNQKGYNSMASLKGSVCPLYGVAKAVPADETPDLTMEHLSSVVAIKVTNANDEPLKVTTASFTATEDIVGSYFIDITKTPVVYKASGPGYVKNTATVTVTSGATSLAKDESATLYLAIKPFKAASGKKLTLSVNGYSKEITLSKDVTFSAGKIKTLNFSYDKPAVEVEGLSLPWFEDFSGDMSKYTLVNGGSTTKVYTAASDNLAGGTAPELLISKSNGSFSANIATDGYVGKLTLTFKCNYPERISVTSATSGVVISKKSNVEYQLDVDESVDVFELKLTNTSGSNARIDDVLLVKGVQQAQTLTFEQSALSFYIGSDEAAAFTGQVVQGAKTTVTYSSNNEEVASVDPETGVVTLKDVEGTATITARAVATAEYKEATATYIIALNKQSQGGVAKQYSFTITRSDFNSTSYAANNNEKTSTAIAGDGSEMEVKWTSNQVMNQNSTMQWKKNEGYIYNSTDLGTIDEVTITSTAGTFTKYIGPALKPTANSEGGYFQIKVGGATGKVTSIKVTFTK